MKGAAAASFLLRVGKMVKAKRERAKTKISVKVLDGEKITRVSEIKVVVRGGKIFTFRISRPLLDARKLILHDERGSVVLVTSRSGLPRDIQVYFERQGLEPLYIYPATQRSLV
jgi:hypothetical protein